MTSKRCPGAGCRRAALGGANDGHRSVLVESQELRQAQLESRRDPRGDGQRGAGLAALDLREHRRADTAARGEVAQRQAGGLAQRLHARAHDARLDGRRELVRALRASARGVGLSPIRAYVITDGGASRRADRACARACATCASCSPPAAPASLDPPDARAGGCGIVLAGARGPYRDHRRSGICSRLLSPPIASGTARAGSDRRGPSARARPGSARRRADRQVWRCRRAAAAASRARRRSIRAPCAGCSPRAAPPGPAGARGWRSTIRTAAPIARLPRAVAERLVPAAGAPPRARPSWRDLPPARSPTRPTPSAMSQPVDPRSAVAEASSRPRVRCAAAPSVSRRRRRSCSARPAPSLSRSRPVAGSEASSPRARRRPLLELSPPPPLKETQPPPVGRPTWARARRPRRAV